LYSLGAKRKSASDQGNDNKTKLRKGGKKRSRKKKR